jgi:hypothetical protein
MIASRDTKTTLNKEAILNKISEYDIFRYYIDGDFKINGMISSPLRADDKNPSFGVFSTDNGLRFKDQKTGVKGDCFQFVMEKYNYKFIESLQVIDMDFNLKLGTFAKKSMNFTNGFLAPKNLKPEVILKPRKYDIKVRYRKWLLTDIKYWEQYGISKSTCQHFSVTPIDYYWIENTRVKCLELAYCIIVGSRIKIYQPYAEKNSYYNKWYGNCNMNSIHGFNTIPESGNLLIITSSNKECMFFAENLKIPTISPNAEGVLISDKIFETLKKRYKRLIIFYDWDEAGINFAKQHSEYYGIDYIVPKGITEVKDPTDYCKLYGKQLTIKLLNNELGL